MQAYPNFKIPMVIMLVLLGIIIPVECFVTVVLSTSSWLEALRVLDYGPIWQLIPTPLVVVVAFVIGKKLNAPTLWQQTAFAMLCFMVTFGLWTQVWRPYEEFKQNPALQLSLVEDQSFDMTDR